MKYYIWDFIYITVRTYPDIRIGSCHIYRLTFKICLSCLASNGRRDVNYISQIFWRKTAMANFKILAQYLRAVAEE